MIAKLRKINDVLPEMIFGNLIFGVFVQLIALFLTDVHLPVFSIGLWIGVAVSIIRIIHMAWTYNRALDFDEKTATNIMTKHNLIAYAYRIIVLGIVCVVAKDAAVMPVAVFVGMLGQKVAAYLQPFTHKLFRR